MTDNCSRCISLLHTGGENNSLFSLYHSSKWWFAVRAWLIYQTTVLQGSVSLDFFKVRVSLKFLLLLLKSVGLHEVSHPFLVLHRPIHRHGRLLSSISVLCTYNPPRHPYYTYLSSSSSSFLLSSYVMYVRATFILMNFHLTPNSKLSKHYFSLFFIARLSSY